LVCDDGKQTIEIDSRTSDAVALAIRFKCPIYTYEKIMSQAGIIVQDEKEGEKKEEKPGGLPDEESNPYVQYTTKELEDLINKVVKNEEFEKAAQIRDEINRRRASSG
jgi:bifunctional DNase/RNase